MREIYPKPSREIAKARRQAMMEAIWVAAEMRAGRAFAHSAIALDAFGLEGSGEE